MGEATGSRPHVNKVQSMLMSGVSRHLSTQMLATECFAQLRTEERIALAHHLSEKMLERFRQRRLAPAELLAIDDHVMTCQACRERLYGSAVRRDALASLQASLRQARTTTDHLTDDCLQAYIGGRLDAVDRELAESHLECCKRCQARQKEVSHEREG
jgi:anti-sigma factor RsiW